MSNYINIGGNTRDYIPSTYMRKIMPRNSSRATSLSAIVSIHVAAMTKPYSAIGTCTKIVAGQECVKSFCLEMCRCMDHALRLDKDVSIKTHCNGCCHSSITSWSIPHYHQPNEASDRHENCHWPSPEIGVEIFPQVHAQPQGRKRK